MSKEHYIIKKESNFQYISKEYPDGNSITRNVEGNTTCESPVGEKLQSTSQTSEQIRVKTKNFCAEIGCNKIFSTKGNLKAHQMKHQGLQPFKCNFSGCQKAYSEKCRLRTHMRTHTGDQPFQCRYCSKKFNENGNLKTHERIHTDDRPFHCAFPGCQAKFRARGHLMDHARSHTKIKLFKCEECGKSYTRSSTLKAHMVKFHSKAGENIFKLPLFNDLDKSNNISNIYEKNRNENEDECDFYLMSSSQLFNSFNNKAFKFINFSDCVKSENDQFWNRFCENEK